MKPIALLRSELSGQEQIDEQKKIAFWATIVRLELSEDERSYTTTAHIKAVLKVLKRKGVLR